MAGDDPAVVAWEGAGDMPPTPCPPDETQTPTLVALQAELARWGLSLPAAVLPPPTAEELAVLKADLKAQVDAKAEALRLTLITAGSGQAMEYQEAYAQAQAALSAAGPVQASDYPMLAATIGVDIDPDRGNPAADVLGVARSVKAAYEAFLRVGAAIRGARLLAKVEIDAAPDADLARAVVAAIKWPAPAA
ncbi:hypothetical protein ACN9MF_20170 [Methylobacterium fujisawaense]|uniref:hypothetical protein n=1 Tax=Methylobacterium fujisawaense TaxID=107400 RepID=UPI003CF79C96